jgi:hypothetical protein
MKKLALALLAFLFVLGCFISRPQAYFTTGTIVNIDCGYVEKCILVIRTEDKLEWEIPVRDTTGFKVGQTFSMLVRK